ncbi:MAG: recombinase family protein [Gaiellaceae bacterium]
MGLAAYSRVSTAGQAHSGLGIEAQRKSITDYAQAQGLEVSAWHEDAGRSGATLRGRAGLAAALADVKAGRAEGVIVAKIDRLGRSTHDVSGIVERAWRDGWRVIAVDVGLDTATPTGEMVATALMMAARFEWHRTSDRQREKHDALRRARRPRGRASAPRELADRLADLRTQGSTFSAIANLLNEEGTATPQGGRLWYPASVRSVLRTREREVEAGSE